MKGRACDETVHAALASKIRRLLVAVCNDLRWWIRATGYSSTNKPMPKMPKPEHVMLKADE
jgi:hypothetical protein